MAGRKKARAANQPDKPPEERTYGGLKLLRVLAKLNVSRDAFLKAWAAEGDTRDRSLRSESIAVIEKYVAKQMSYKELCTKLGKTEATVDKMIRKYHEADRT